MGNKHRKDKSGSNSYPKKNPEREIETMETETRENTTPSAGSLSAEKTDTVTSRNNELSNISANVNTLKSLMNSLAQVKFAKQEDIKQLADGIVGLNENLNSKLDKKFNDSVNELKNSMQAFLQDVQSSNDSINAVDKKLSGLPKREELSYSEAQIKGEIKSAAQRSVTTLQGDISRLRTAVVDESGQSVIRAVKNISKAQRSFQENTSESLKNMESTLKTISENTETIYSLPGKIDGISKILEDKGLQLKQDFPTVNHDEETLAELAECGEKILQQLAIAARWYARKLPELEAHEDSIKNLEKTKDEAVKQAHKDGFEDGCKAVIAELLGAYDDLHRLMNPTSDEAFGQVETLATFLSNSGVEPIYKTNQEIEITADNLMNYEHNIADLKPGKIVITSPGYTFNSKTLEKAKYIPAEEFYAEQETHESELEENSLSETKTDEEFHAGQVTYESELEENSLSDNYAEKLNETETDEKFYDWRMTQEKLEEKSSYKESIDDTSEKG